MRIEKKQDEEIARRKGMTGKTVVQVIWLLLSAGLSYYLINYLLNSDESSFSYNAVYNATGLPRTVPEGALLAGMILLLVLLFQIFLWLGFAMASPEGRRKTGVPSLHSRNKDPFDQGH